MTYETTVLIGIIIFILLFIWGIIELLQAYLEGRFKPKIRFPMMDRIMASIIRSSIRYLSTIDCLNNGGCLYAAYAIYKHLSDCGWNCSSTVIIQLSSHDSYIENNAAFLAGKDNLPTSDNHFAISFNNGKTFYDSNGKIDKDKYSHYLIVPNDQIEKFCAKLLERPGHPMWNDMFDWEEYLPAIEKHFDIKFPILKN